MRLALDFEAQLPQVFARTGYAGDFFMVGQWFPKLGVWQEGAWNAYPFHANAEFYADFGDYEVAITLPDAYVTGGTGLLVSAAEETGGLRTVRYRAEDVIDFAWTASPHFLEATRQVGETELLYLYLPEHEHGQARPGRGRGGPDLLWRLVRPVSLCPADRGGRARPGPGRGRDGVSLPWLRPAPWFPWGLAWATGPGTGRLSWW